MLFRVLRARSLQVAAPSGLELGPAAKAYFLPPGYLARVVRWWIELFVGLALAGFAHSKLQGVSFTAAPQKAERPSALLNASSGLLANSGRIGVQ